MRRIAWLAVFVALGVAAAVTAGPEAPMLEEQVAAIDAVAAEPDGVRVVAGHLSRKLAISFETLQAQRTQMGLGWGQFLVAHYLARDATVPVEQVVGELHGGKAWVAIAADHHVDLARLTGEVQESRDAIEQRSEDRARTGAPAPANTRAGKGEGTRGGRRQRLQ
jgi:hypothetical protein